MVAVTLHTLKQLSIKARPDMDSFLNCNPINPTIRDNLQSYGLQVDLIDGTISTGRSHIGGEEHMFIYVDSDCVVDSSSNKPIIVDGAVDQFCTERYESGEVFVNLESYTEIDTVVVLEESDKLYTAYFEESNW